MSIPVPGGHSAPDFPIYGWQLVFLILLVLVCLPEVLVYQYPVDELDRPAAKTEPDSEETFAFRISIESNTGDRALDYEIERRLWIEKVHGALIELKVLAPDNQIPEKPARIIPEDE